MDLKKQIKEIPLKNLKNFNKLKLDAFCSELRTIRAEQDLLNFVNKKNEIIILGEGSNVVLDAPSYRPFITPVFINQIKGKRIENIFGKDVHIRCNAGENWHEFVLWTLRKKIQGLECLAGIPGSVGAAPIQNIGAYGSEVSEAIHSLRVYDIKKRVINSIKKEDCEFDYRTSYFKKESKNSSSNYIIVSIDFKLSKEWNNPNIPQYESIKKFLPETPDIFAVAEQVMKVRNSKLPNLKDYPNVGSFFLNPIISKRHAADLKKKYPLIRLVPTADGMKISAAWLIEQCKFKGKRYGNLGMFAKHALVLVNYDKANASEIFYLATVIQNQVMKKFDISLTIEPIIISSAEKPI
jgi:UDP-N-acetylmuramate dehydrogenase